jgi:hypothetical protein
MMTRSCAAVIVGLSVAGCAERAPGDRPTDPAAMTIQGELADFQWLELSAAWDCTQGTTPASDCQDSFELGKNGRLLHVNRGRRFEAQVPAADFDPLIELATSQSFIDSLGRLPGCPSALHYGELIEIEIVPGLIVSAETSGCAEGPVAALEGRLRALTRRLFPESTTEAGRPVPDPDMRTPFRLQTPLTFSGLWIERIPMPCPAPPALCKDHLSIDTHVRAVTRYGASPSGSFFDVSDYEPVASVAVSPPVVAEMRKPSPCPPGTGVAEEKIRVYFGGRMYAHQADSAGCSQGPIEDLRQAGRELIQRLAGAPRPDAGPADHPPDLR